MTWVARMTSGGARVRVVAASLLTLLAFVETVAAQGSLRYRMLIAEDQRAASDADLAPLRQGLSSSDPKIRLQAVRSIGRLERPDLLPLISRLLTDANVDVRTETVNAVGQLAKGETGVAAAQSRLLARARAEQDPRVRGVVAATLGRLAYATEADVRKAEEAIAVMLPAPAVASGPVRVGRGGGGPATTAAVNLDEIAGAVEGLEALIRQSGKIARPGSDTIARLRAASSMQGRTEDAERLTRIRRLARAALNAAGVADRELLESGVADPDDEIRRLTMIAARADTPGRREVLTKGLEDANPRVRYEALQTWGRQLQKESCAPVIAALRDPNPHVMLLAIDALGNGCPAAESPVAQLSALVEVLTAKPGAWHAPAHAIVSLARIAPDEARKALPRFVTHGTWQVRMYAARAAGVSIDAPPDAPAEAGALKETNQTAEGPGFSPGSLLQQLALDAHDNVREAALSELVRLKREEAIPLAIEALQRRDYQLLLAAARALSVPAARSRAVAPLLAALDRVSAEKRDTARDPRMAILHALEQLGSTDGAGLGSAEQNEKLRPYVHDFDRAVAFKAAELLQRWTKTDVAATPKPLPLPVMSEQDLAALAGTRLRFVMAGKGAFELRLLDEQAPLSAWRVSARAREGYYNGLTFHRVAPNFVIQGGSPGANEYVGDGPYMRDEVGLVSHRRGTVGISTRGRDTGDAQIFINLVDSPRLDHTYTVFADVVSGMDVVDAILEGDVIERVEILGKS